jgi:hydroxyethylthiazole kinase
MKDTVIKNAAAIADAVRSQSPLVHCMTNPVTVNDVANILLAAGASPAMIEAADEAEGFAAISSALYLNIGTLYKELELAMTFASLGAKRAGRPIIIDPVACGAIPSRAALVERLGVTAPFALIKGNMGEIIALAGGSGGSKGVDSDGDMAGIEEAAVAVAQKYRCAVAATGKRDVVTDGTRVIRLCNGHEMLTRITGAGCMVGGLCAAACSAALTVPGAGMFDAAAAGISMMSIAGEIAAATASKPGSFRTALIDAMFDLTGTDIEARARIEVIA